MPFLRRKPNKIDVYRIGLLAGEILGIHYVVLKKGLKSWAGGRIKSVSQRRTDPGGVWRQAHLCVPMSSPLDEGSGAGCESQEGYRFGIISGEKGE